MKFYPLFSGSAELASSLAGGVLFPIQASDTAYIDSPARAKTASTTLSVSTYASPSGTFIRQQRLKRFSLSASDKSNPADIRRQRESDDSLESALPPSPTTSSFSYTSDASATCMFEVDDMIQVDRTYPAPWYGVIRWIGTLPGYTTLSAGLEMVK